MPCLSMLTEPLLLRFNSENSSESLWPLNSTSAAHQIPTRIRPVWAIWLRPNTGAATLENNSRVCNDPSEADRREISKLQQKELRVDPGRILTPGTPPQNLPGTSLVAQWLRIRLPMQGMGVRAWSGKIPHAAEQLSLCATTTKPVL